MVATALERPTGGRSKRLKIPEFHVAVFRRVVNHAMLLIGPVGRECLGTSRDASRPGTRGASEMSAGLLFD
jgi:hypothetical protein